MAHPLKPSRSPLFALALVVGMTAAAGGAFGQAAPFAGQGNQDGTIPPLALYPVQGVMASGSFAEASLFPGALPGCSPAPNTSMKQPKVVSTFPAKDAVVRPGLVVVRVTFDRPMSCDASFSGLGGLPNPCPSAWQSPSVSRDRKSFRIVCKVEPDTHYALSLRHFRSVRNVVMQPVEVTFSTSRSPQMRDLTEALAEDVGAKTLLGG